MRRAPVAAPDLRAGKQVSPSEAPDFIKKCELILEKDPSHLQAMQVLGTFYAQQKRFDRAIPLLRAAQKRDPDNPVGLNNLGMALQTTGECQEAISCFRKAVELRPSYGMALNNLGNILAEQGNHEAAIQSYQTVLSITPNDAVALNNLGAALRSTGRTEEAVLKFQAALIYMPEFIQARMSLAISLRELERVDEAIACYKTIILQDNTNFSAHFGLAELLQKSGQYHAAIGYFKSASVLKPAESMPLFKLGIVLQELGHIDVAIGYFRRAIDLTPDCSRYYLSLAQATKLAADDPYFLSMQRLLRDRSSLDDADCTDLHFALGKVYSDLGAHQLSFDHFLEGNKLRRRSLTYDEKHAINRAKKLCEFVSADTVATLAKTGHSSSLPIFIVGMPRSGSTLVEQILASHPEIYGAGEISSLSDTFHSAASRFGRWQSLVPVENLTILERISVSEDYLDRLRKLVPNRMQFQRLSRIINKTLSNYQHVALIHILFPNARIIHTIRDPIDTCLSCFSTFFHSQDFTFDLGELGRRYRSYGELMKHWHEILPHGTIYDVHYEDVVEDLEQSARALIAYCGLAWDDACLNFHKSNRPVRTASVHQVRKPIYRSSVKRWRPDDEILRPLLDGLGIY
ncbi:sulfotransferase [Nguyenibacter sp. L1]|uniref:sulfotransferase n=1 Tax=Nguyenibacter sp. L1 TaxID=3049350 RepID=UPI002B484BA6|nr:sulfotransferase [Nguyenibacter sp. L1]WRH86756.1 tetratricopeptide repeat protein [Nguyenibacter sp. L1]